MLRVLLTLATLGLTLYALIDCIRTEDSRVKGIPKIMWILLILLIWVVGPLAWIIAGRERTWEPPQRPANRRPSAPDDDPDFLRDLDLDLKRERNRKRPEEDPPTA